MAVLWGTETFDSSTYSLTQDAAYGVVNNQWQSLLPNNWVKFSDTASAGDSDSMVVGYAFPASENTEIGPAKQSESWGSLITDVNNRSRGWIIGYQGTSSNSTGPSGGNTGNRYLLYEATSLGHPGFADNSTDKRSLSLIRTPAIDASSYTSTTPIKLYGKYHAYGNAMGAFGVACTTSANAASSLFEAFTGSGFTGSLPFFQGSYFSLSTAFSSLAFTSPTTTM